MLSDWMNWGCKANKDGYEQDGDGEQEEEVRHIDRSWKLG